MKYRRLGQSEMRVSAIVFGAWAIGGAMWGGTDDQAAVEAIQAALDLGVNAVDTAPIYGLGHSERLVGKAVAGKRDKVFLFTKFGLRADLEEGEYYFTMDLQGKGVKVYRNSRKRRVIEECERSLKNLGTDYIDLYQAHWRDRTVPVEEPMEAVAELIKQGKVRYAGVSNYSVPEIEAARRCVPLVSVQPPYSLVNRGVEKDVLPYCRDRGIGVLVYSPLQRGLLTGKFQPDHRFPPGDHRANQPFFRPENIRRVNRMIEEIRPIAAAHQAAPAQVILAWTVRQPGVTAALVGARNAKQAQENARAGEIDLSPEELQRLAELADRLDLDLS